MITKSPSIMGRLSLLFIIAIFFSCGKDEPSTEASIETTMDLYTNAAMQGKLTIEQAFITVSEVEIIANRTDGNQFTFQAANEQEDHRVVLTGSNIDAPFNFKAQQGKYEPIHFTLILEPDPHQLQVTPGSDGNPPVVDYADFLQNARPSIAFRGEFNNRGESINVFISISMVDILRFSARQRGGSQIAMSKENRAQITIDPAFLLQDLTTQRLENAAMFEYLGEKTILIHSDFNRDLYNDIEDRVYDPAGYLAVEMVELNANG